MTDNILLIDRLADGDTLSHAEFLTLLSERDEETVAYLTKKDDEERRRVYQTRVFVRGLIEISNV
ncbi:MAG: [Clostridia bacterium]|nr:[FeFe] hydrogenase H-cluster radical SAM maturase HydE [Clostridia bacterium]